MTTYQVTARRDGKFWFVQIPAIDGATQARTLAEIPAMATDYIAIMTNEDPSNIGVEVELVLPETVRKHIDRANTLRAKEAEARAQAAQEVQDAVRTLSRDGYTVRDIGAALDVSYQRAHQLLKEYSEAGSSKQLARIPAKKKGAVAKRV